VSAGCSLLLLAPLPPLLSWNGRVVRECFHGWGWVRAGGTW
jgi:hypothetical protein